MCIGVIHVEQVRSEGKFALSKSGAGQWSSDGLEHGGTINQNDPFCDDNSFPTCAESCQTCANSPLELCAINNDAGPAGKYLTFTLNRFLHLGEESCAECEFCTDRQFQQ